MSDRDFKLTIQSAVRDYTVQETGDWLAALEALMAPGDAIMIDPAIYHGYSEQVDDLVSAEGAFLYHAVADQDNHVFDYATPDDSMKTMTGATTFLIHLLEKGISRHNRLFVIGGGSVMDLGGFCASVYMRGVPWVYFPTTLLAQADSCIGGKTSLNLGGYKNIIGTIWPPEGVLIDRSFLFTLPYLEQLSGVGEMLHFFMVQGGQWYDWVKGAMTTLIDPDPEYAHGDLVKAARATLTIKKEYIEQDERDTGVRRLLNFGHTFGHAIEAVDPKIPHGIAVARGIEIACDISWKKGFLDDNIAQEMVDTAWEVVYRGFCSTVDFPTGKPLIQALQQDKKRSGKPGVVNAILTRGPGEMFETELGTDEIAEFLGA